MNYEAQPSSHIERLIAFYARELHVEIVINKDSTGFWGVADEDIFGVRLTSFREGISAFVKRLSEEGDMFNYFSAFCFRVNAQPYAQPAIDVFCEGFDSVSGDELLKAGYSWNTRNLTPIGKLLLFLTVHRNEIYIAMRMREAEEGVPPKQKPRR